ncbi:MAG: hypothetical protein ACK49N_12060 [Verrucomicrobiota bacterium]
MDWIFDHFQIVLIVALAFASWVKSRQEAKQAEREAREAGELPDMEDIFGPEESWQPEAEPMTNQPPPVPSQSARNAFPAQEPVPDYELERQNALREQLRQIREAKAITTGNAAATRERANAKGKAAAPVATSLRGMLRNRSELRKAVITREVLGTPVGLR